MAPRHLAAQHLGLELHAPGARHDPEADASAVMQLYMELIHPRLMSATELEVHFEARERARIAAWAAGKRPDPS